MERFSTFAVLIGIAIIVCGCFYAVALHNPGGPPPLAPIRQRADSIARWSCGIGAMVAIGYPTLAFLIRFFRPQSPRIGRDTESSHEVVERE